MGLNDESEIDNFVTDKWYSNLSVVRWIFAIFGILMAVFTGGCSLFFSGVMILGPKINFSDPYTELALYLIAIGFATMLAGALIWWLAAKKGRRPQA